MKELSIEEKAKRYDNAIKLVNSKWYYRNQPCFINVSELFPELKKSEDEIIKKALLEMVNNTKGDDLWINYNVHKEEAVAWLEKQCNKDEEILILKDQIESLYAAIKALKEAHKIELEKQGEQKSVNKVESKFKVGDWIIDKQGIVHQIANVIENVTNHAYGYDIVGGGYFNDNAEGVRLWTIEDAKDGDVLFHSDTASNGIFIFKKIRDDGKVLCYCDYDSEDHFCTGEHHTCCWITDKCIKPTTKEQRDLLFQKMKEAGYKWNTDKKELLIDTNNSNVITIEYCYILSYSLSKIFEHRITKDEVTLSIGEFLKKHGLNEDECSIMYSTDRLNLEPLKD